MSRSCVFLATAVGWAALGPWACISDHAVEANVDPNPGAVQPDGGSSANVAASAACARIEKARSGAATKLGCDAPKEACPKLLYVAGSLPCDEYTGGSIDACEARIAAYSKCSDFDIEPCVATAVPASCHAIAPAEAGATHDAGKLPQDAAAAKPPKDAAKGG